MDRLGRWLLGRDKGSPLRPLDGRDRTVLLLSGSGVLLFAALFVRFLLQRKMSGSAWAGTAAAGMILLLFILLGLSYIPVWVDAWRSGKWEPYSPNTQPGTDAQGVKKEKRKDRIGIFVLYLGYGLLMLLLVMLIRHLQGRSGSLSEAIKPFLNTDSAHYLDIARDGYLSDPDRIVQIVFFPLFPFLVRLFSYVIPEPVIAGFLIAFLCFAFSGVVLYDLFRMDHSRKTALWTLLFLLLIPGGFFFFSPMTESLFLLLSTLCFLFLRKEKFIPACLTAGLASLTRSAGLFLSVPILFALIMGLVRKKEKRPLQILLHLLPLLLIPAFFSIYLYCNVKVGGSPLFFLKVQKEHWYQQMGLFFDTAAYQTDYLLRSAAEADWERILGLRIPQLLALFLSLAVYIPSVRKMYPANTCYFIAYYLFSMGATWLLSAPRYLIVLFMLPEALAVWTKSHRGRKAVCLSVEICMAAAYLVFFTLRWQVW